MGGDCLNTGCVPSKALLASARAGAAVGARTRRSASATRRPTVDFAAVNRHVHEVIAAIAPNDSVERFVGLGVRVVKGSARFTGPQEIAFGGTRNPGAALRRRHGVARRRPPIPGARRRALPHQRDGVREHRAGRRHLVVIGGGPIGLEMAQAHRALGAEVTVLDTAGILPRDDAELVALLRQRLSEDGIDLREGVRIARVERDGDGIAVVLTSEAGEERIEGSHLLVAAGRTPNLDGLDLEKAGIVSGPRGITVDARLQTSNRRVFAIGDVAGGPQFTHVAATTPAS
jgi:pyruvate/2-oxoglutarate dehydrogenase complex dihydrolipoamide dehydrogenase (E3) component